MISKVSVTTTATLCLAATNKLWMILQNQSDTDIYLAFEGTSAVTTDVGASPGIKLAAGASIAFTDDYHRGAPLTDAIYAIHGSTGTKALVIHYKPKPV